MITNIHSSIPLSFFGMLYKGSTANEDSTNYGISHLMEHLISKNLKPLYEDFTKCDIMHNAYTSHDSIVFFMSGLSKYVEYYRKDFFDLINHFKITDDILAIEKNIVLQEYYNYFASQAAAHFLNFMRRKYNNFDPIGEKSCIENITLEDCRNYWHKQFEFPDIVLNISDNPFFPSEDKSVISNKHLILGEPNPSAPTEHLSEFKDTRSVILYKKMDGDIRYYHFLTDVLGKGLESPLYQNLREDQGLVYYIESNIYPINNNQCLFLITSEMENENVDKFVKSVHEVMSQDIEQSRFEILKSNFLSNIERKEVIPSQNFNKYLEPEKYISSEFINGITYEKINQVYDDCKSLEVSIDSDEELK